MAELIKMPFGAGLFGSRNHVLDGVQIPMGRGTSEGNMYQPIVKYLCMSAYTFFASYCW